MRKVENLVGQRFNRLVVKAEAGRDKFGKVRWLCECDCGNTVIVSGSNVKRSVSCGCYRREVLSKNCFKPKHGESNTRLHRIWGGMMTRCNNPNAYEYCNYGGRGINVCDEWRDYEKFREWAYDNGFDPKYTKKEMTLDRIDNDGNYEPSNCRFVDSKTQCRNRRSNRMITYNGETHCMIEWAEIMGITYPTLQGRIRNGWSVEDALTKPLVCSR